MAGLRLDLLDPGVLHLAPELADLAGGLGVAVVVDRLLLLVGHLVVLVLIDHEGEGRDIERRLHVVLRHLVDAKQQQRAPREGDGVGDAALDNVADLRRRGLHVGAAELGHEIGHGGMGGTDLHALDVVGHDDLLGPRMKRRRRMDEAEAELDVLHLLLGIFPVPGVERH